MVLWIQCCRQQRTALCLSLLFCSQSASNGSLAFTLLNPTVFGTGFLSSASVGKLWKIVLHINGQVTTFLNSCPPSWHRNLSNHKSIPETIICPTRLQHTASQADLKCLSVLIRFLEISLSRCKFVSHMAQTLTGK